MGSTEDISVVVQRGPGEVEFSVRPGPLGGMPVALKYPSTLSLALEDIMGHLGHFADYDWLAALTGESFSLSAHDAVCRAWWPGGLAGAYLEDVALMTGVKLEKVYGPEMSERPTEAIRDALAHDHPVLVFGGWPEHRISYWGVAAHDDDDGRIRGYTADAAGELPLAGPVAEAYALSEDRPWEEPDELLALVLTQALELGQARTETGWKSGIQAYDLLITSLDSVPFCPVCGEEESQSCFDRLLWALVAHKESANRFLVQMREAIPDQAELIDEIVGDNRAIVGKLEGISRSGTRVGNTDDQRKIQRVLLEVQIIENDLIGLYENLLASLTF
jgi:hypothetical protein